VLEREVEEVCALVQGQEEDFGEIAMVDGEYFQVGRKRQQLRDI
jgi:hypothetical protein